MPCGQHKRRRLFYAKALHALSPLVVKSHFGVRWRRPLSADAILANTADDRNMHAFSGLCAVLSQIKANFCLQPRRHNTAKLQAVDADRYVASYLQRSLKKRRDAILDAPHQAGKI
jgi:hypothetical protein